MPLKYHNKHTYLFVYCLISTKETGEQTLSNLGYNVFSMQSSAGTDQTLSQHWLWKVMADN